MKPETFHIIGGGIAGLASAMAVNNAGHGAFILEKAVRFEEVGAGLQLGPNAVRALQKLGAWDAVAPITSSPQEIQIRDGRDGKILKRVTLGKSFEQRFGMPYRVAHRADLLQALLDVAKSKSEISLALNFAVDDHTIYENVVAADGVWSKTRQAMFPNSAPIVAPDLFYRALLPNPKTDCVTLWLYPGGHVVHYPVGNPAKLNLIAITQGQVPLTHYENACDELKQTLSQVSNWTTWPAAYTQPLKAWNQGTTTLIGDAAHATLPYLAQGAAMALEDAATLGTLLKSDLHTSEAFARLSKLRTGRTKKLLEASLRAGRIYHSNGLVAVARNLYLQTVPSHLFLQQMAWIYDSDF